MNLRTGLLKLINCVYKRELDPGRVERTFKIYDQDRAYGPYHEFCKQKFSRQQALLSGNPLEQQGLEYLNVLSPTTAQALIRKVQETHDISYIKKDTKNLEGYHLSKPEIIKEILSLVLNDEVDKRLASFFKSEYLVHWVIFSKTPQAKEQKSVSFRWHCDKGPKKHLKLIVYLNPSAEHGGSTEFINLQDTASVGSKGYVFGWTKTRTGDTRHLERIAGHSLSTHLHDFKTGEAVLFQPSNVLHRAISPTLGPRYTITLNLLPSPVHWQSALDSGTLSDLAVDGAWHKHADQLLDTLEMKHPN